MYRKISNFLIENVSKSLYPLMNRLSISQPAKPLMQNRIPDRSLEADYRDMARDEDREAKALDWAEGTIGEIDGQPR